MSHQAALQVMAKPAGAACNMDCDYCFYLHKAELLGQGKAERMSPEVLQEHVRQTLASAPDGEVVFAWQGGEPTLAGLAFYERAVELQQRYRGAGQQVHNSLQTNGILVDDTWCSFFARHGFLVGLSVDGPRELHDQHRVTRGGTPTFDRVMSAAQCLRRHQVPFSALCVVARDNARRPLDVYRFLARELRPRMIQFIPGYEPVGFETTAPGAEAVGTMPVSGTPRARPGHPASVVMPWSVDPADWGRFLCAVWDEWLARDYGRVFVDIFEDAVAAQLGLASRRCVTAPTCGDCLALEADGALYACDHYVYPEHRLGNILAQHQDLLARSSGQQAFGQAKRSTLTARCRACPHLALCGGDCPKSRFVRAPGGEPGLSYLCPGHEAFYAHIARDLKAVARKVQRHTAA